LVNQRDATIIPALCYLKQNSYYFKVSDHYDSGREGDWFRAGFSPRKNQFSIHLLAGLESHEDLLNQLGKYKIGKSCLYIKR